MATQIILLVLIVALIVYSIFLQIQLTRKNIFIETTVRRLSMIEKTHSMEEMMAFLQEIQRVSQYSSYFADKLLEKETIDFIFENIKDMRIYMHYTKNAADAKSILSDGFKFANSFYKTALPVSKDKLDLKIKHNNRKFFGDYLIIITISNDIVNYYSMELEKAGIKDYTFENILTETTPARDDNTDHIYQLAPQFIKGYVNHKTGEVVRNQVFDPYYNSPTFQKNIDLLKSK